jgi:hypothetical protein
MWDVLAIAPTDDPKVIRRAYAARLKQIDPDRDRETFARLRQALEWALACAGQPMAAPSRRPEREDDPVRDRASADHLGLPVMVEFAQAPHPQYDVRISVAEPAEPTRGAHERASERAMLAALESALQRSNTREASRLYMRAAATGALPLGDAERVLARLFAVALEDPNCDGPTFRDLARTFGWDRPELASPTIYEVRARVTPRLAAEDWYDELVRTADSKWLWFPRYKSRVARLLLRRIRGWGLLRINRPALRATLGFLESHAIWLSDRIPPEWIAELERRMRRRELFANGAGIFILSFALADAVFVFGGRLLGWNEDDGAYAIATLSAITALLIVLLRALVKHFIGMSRSPP